MVDLATGCETLLNADMYTKNIVLKMENGYKDTTPIEIVVDEVFEYDSAKKTYKVSDVIPKDKIGSNLDSSGGTSCKCENYIKEIEYKIKIQKGLRASAATGAVEAVKWDVSLTKA